MDEQVRNERINDAGQPHRRYHQDIRMVEQSLRAIQDPICLSNDCGGRKDGTSRGKSEQKSDQGQR